MGRQTTVQEKNAIRFGSGKFEVKPEGGTYVNLGAMRDIEFEETWDKVRVMSDNAGAIVLGIRNHQAALKGSLMEINLERLSELRGGLDTYAVEDDTPVGVDDEAVTLTTTDAIRLANKNANNTEVASIAVFSAIDSGGTESVRDTDYVAGVDAMGYTIIARTTTGNIGAGDTVYVSYTYTPADHVTLQSGHAYSINPVAVKVTNVDEDGNEFIIEVFKATTEDGITIALQADDDEDPAMTPINLMGEVDTSSATNKLFKIYDYQTV